MTRGDGDALLLGEWACLGILGQGPAHGFAVASRLKPQADLGRIWSLSRALTYRSLDQLQRRGLVEPIGEEPGIAGGNRTVLAITPAGRVQLEGWLRAPVEHLRDLRSELLLKLALASAIGVEVDDMLRRQRARVAELAAAFDDGAASTDPVQLWRHEFTVAALRFLDRLG